MAVKTFNIKDAYIPELIEVFGELWGEFVLEDDVLVPNPQTKGQYASEQFDLDIKGYIHRRVKAYRKKIALIDDTPITE